jgi:hypothetical protein
MNEMERICWFCFFGHFDLAIYVMPCICACIRKTDNSTVCEEAQNGWGGEIVGQKTDSSTVCDRGSKMGHFFSNVHETFDLCDVSNGLWTWIQDLLISYHNL